MKNNTYTCYQTDVPNICGGFNTYNSLSMAIDRCKHHVFAVTKVKIDNNLGIDTNGYLFKTLWRTLIYSK